VRVKQIKNRLEKVRNQRQLARRSRQRAEIPGVSLVGYTNTGKSTLFNLLTESKVFAADQLFATLDPTVRRVEIPKLGAVTLADTVGFIRHLPHKLVEAFRATLEESANADLLLHVIDAQSPERDEQIKQVHKVLQEIDADNVQVLEVYNKIDLLDHVDPHIQRDEQGKPVRVWLSAQEQQGIELLQQAIAELLEDEIYIATVRLSQQHSRLRGKLFDLNAVQQETHTEDGASVLTLRVAKMELDQLLSHEGLSADEFFAQYTHH
ncbi:MAG: GTPase HflX, partial [Pseudomonas sp.]|nr:GTPase HflX [Pseudomonas sp.]